MPPSPTPTLLHFGRPEIGKLAAPHSFGPVASDRSNAVTRNSRFVYFLTLRWNPAALRVLSASSASKSPVSSKVSLRALAVLPVTPLTSPRAELIPRLHEWQQFWMPKSVSDLTFPWPPRCRH